MKVFVQHGDNPGRGSFLRSIFCLSDDDSGNAADERKRRQQILRLSSFAVIDLALQQRIVVDQHKIGRRFRMTNQEFVFGRDQQYCKRRLVPVCPKPVAQCVPEPERFRQTNAVGVSE